jgi:hypothetical protein
MRVTAAAVGRAPLAARATEGPGIFHIAADIFLAKPIAASWD